MKSLVLFVCAGVVLVGVGVAPIAAAIESQVRTKLVREGKYDEIIRLRETELRQRPSRDAVSKLADEWVRFHSLDEAAEHYASREPKDAVDVLILAEINGRLGRLDRVPEPPSDLPEALRAAFNDVYFDYALFDRIDWNVPLGGQRINDRLIIYLNRTGRFDLAAGLLEDHLALGSEEARRRQAGMRYQVMLGLADNPERLYLLLHQRAFRLDELHAKYRDVLASDTVHPAVYHEYVRILDGLEVKREAQAFVGRIDEDAFRGVLTAIAVREAEGNHKEVIRLCTKALEMPIPEDVRRAWTWGWSAMNPADEVDRLIRADIRKRLAQAYQAGGELDKAKAIYTSFLDKEWRRNWSEGLRGLEAIAEAEHDETFDLHGLIEKRAASDDPIQTERQMADLYGRLRDTPHRIEHERRAINLMLDAGPQGTFAASVPHHVRGLARLLQREKMEKERAELLDAALNRMSTWERHSDHFVKGLFDLYSDAGNNDAAIELLFEMIEGGKLKASTLHNRLNEGYDVAQKGKLVWEFFRRLEKVIAKYPSTPEYHRVWADAYLDDYQPRRALEFFEKIGADLGPGDYREMARAYEIAKDFANAARCQEKAIAAEWSLDYITLAAYLAQAGEHEKAAEMFVKVIAFTTRPSDLRTAMSRATTVGADGPVIEQLNAIVKDKQATWKHHFVLAELHNARKEAPKAIEHYRLACELNPNQEEVLYRYAWLLRRQKMAHLAVPLYERCFLLPNCPADVGPRLLGLYHEAQRFDDALTLAERLLAERPGQRQEAYQAYLELAKQQDELSRAKTFLERLAHNWPNAESPKRWLDKVADTTAP